MDDWTVARALDALADALAGVPSGSADDGSNPVKVGGVHRTTLPTFADGQRAEFHVDTRGGQYVVLKGAAATSGVGSSNGSTDGLSINSTGILALAELAVFSGVGWDRLRGANVFKPVLNVAVVAGTPQVIWTPAAGKKFRLMGLALSLSVAGFLSLDDGGSVPDVVRLPAMPAGQGIDVETFGNGLLSVAANNTLRVDASANGNVNGMVWGTEE